MVLAMASVAPIRSSPDVGSARNSMSLTPCRSSSNTATPRLISARPYVVASTPRGLRSSRRTPSACSSSAIDRDKAGCTVPICAAALLMLPACTTDIRTRMSCSLRRRSMRSDLSTADSIAELLYHYRIIAFLSMVPSPYGPGVPIGSMQPEMEQTMSRLTWTINAAVIGLALNTLGNAVAQAADWPVRPMTMVVPYAAGGTVDVTARILAPHLSEVLRQQVVIENIGGAGGVIGTQRIANAPADG